jgi:hypothetical protein
MTTQKPECTRAEMMLRQVCSNNSTHLPWGYTFTMDDSLPAEVVEQIVDPADVAAVLDCWRSLMVAAIDEVVRRYKAEAAARGS